ncbi:unnamed protein product [Microthlaspi erraticum]|uniref:Reverse transcriptase Ty1/copia-type domain-containing protein n=1 Tax=Microthlaspi erraticum TaxID=1685480 RepID=A0A6D2K5T5_9BRAS|nr:unnamed protein product [Microthlaspi erraticum]
MLNTSLASRSHVPLLAFPFVNGLELLEVTGFLGSKPASTPLDPSLKLNMEMGTAFPDPTSYRKIIGKLMYLHMTRPDIFYAVNMLCQFSHDPRDVHLKAAHRVLRYLKRTVGQGLFYAANSAFDLRGYADADWGTNTDDRRSISGYCMFIGDSLVSWKSKKQDTVSCSSAEAEFRAMAFATKEMIWLSRLLVSLKIPFQEPTHLYCDNTAAIHIANNFVYHERTKHVEIDCYKIRESIDSGFIKTMFVDSVDNLADCLTKLLHPTMFHGLIHKMGVCNIFQPPS